MAGISLILQNNPTVTVINCGKSSPKLGGTIDISAFPNLQEFRCDNNDITAINGYEDNSNFRVIQFFNNKVTGSIPSLSAKTELTLFSCHINELTGQLPSLSGLSNLEFFSFHTNKFTGPIPSLTGLSNLKEFRCQINQLTGTIPSLSGLSNLENFQCHSQTGATKLTGPIPSLSELNNLSVFNCASNQLTGTIPSLSGLSNLEFFSCWSNQLTNFAGGSVSNTLGDFQAQNNQLRATSVNSILAAFVAAGRTTGTPILNGTCILNLGGTTNSRPTGQGVTDVTTLRNRGWSVTTGTALL